MIVGVMTVQIHLHGITSLKEKRSIVKSVIGRLKSRFNASVAEVDRHDNKSCAVIAMAIVSNDTVFVNQQLDVMVGFIQKDGRFYLGQVHREIF